MDYRELIEKARSLREKVDRLYIYGAGMFGREISGILRRNGIKIDGFVESVCETPREVWDLPVDALDNVISKNCGIIIGMNVDNIKYALANLKLKHFPEDLFFDGGTYCADDKMSRLLHDYPLLEITPVIGCSVNCRYCPQSLLIKKYFEKDKTRKKYMTLEDFNKILDNSPPDCVIDFAGMVEPFLNPDCIAMLESALQRGRKVLLFSTFIGASDDDIEKVTKMPLEAVILHCVDKMGYAHIKEDEKYYARMKKILAAQKNDGTSWITGVIAQTESTPRMQEICRGKHEIRYALHDRAGVYDDAVLAKVKKPHMGRFECSLGGPKCNSHVVLPDGTVVLCNQDFSMKHVLGNIYESSFEELQNGPVMQKILQGMAGDSTIPLICRRCVCIHSYENS